MKFTIEEAQANIKRIKAIPLDKTGHPNPEAWKKRAIKFWEDIIKENEVK